MPSQPVSSARPAKRPRTTGPSSYHDTLPFAGEFGVIHVSEGASQTINGTAYISRRQQSPVVVAGAWEELTSWNPPDDTNMALDPDEDLYNQALDAPVMDEQPLVPVVKKKKKRSLVSV